MQVRVGIAAGMTMLVSVSSERSLTASVATLMVSINLWVMSMTNAFHVRLESMMLVGSVFDNALSSISFMQRVLSLHNVSIAVFPLALVISGLMILDAVLELILGMRMVFLMVMMVITSIATLPLSGNGRYCQNQH